MLVWRVFADDNKKILDMEDDIDSTFEMDDSKILLDCVADTYNDCLLYILSESLRECSKRNYAFRGFEIIAN